LDLLKNQIQHSLQLRPELVATTTNEEELTQLIKQLIQELIDSDFEKLLLILYRLDVDENKVKNAIDLSGPADAPLSIAQLIIEREKERIATRKQYNTGNTDWEF
jgi:siroheme synthase (precorrin-2 oxidase/ferrochelatase)